MLDTSKNIGETVQWFNEMYYKIAPEKREEIEREIDRLETDEQLKKRPPAENSKGLL